jgi:hypothetical protein
MTSANGRFGPACVILTSLLLLTTLMVPPLFAQDPLSEQSRRIREVSSWKMTFRYEMDVNFRNDFGGMGEEVIRFVESAGTVIFTRGPEGERFAGEGRADYRLEYYTLVSADGMFSDSSGSGEKYSMLNSEEGSGSTSIIREVEMNVLEFDFDTHTYMFRIIPGEDHEYDFGVPTRSVMDMKIVDPLVDETPEEVAETIDRDQLKAMFPEHVEWEEFYSSYGVEVFGIPLPFLGLQLCGSSTDSQGGVVTWLIEPALEGPGEDDDLIEAGAWVHHHPGEYDHQNVVKSAWIDIRRASGGAGPGVGGSGSPPNTVYLVAKGGAGPGIPISTGDELVAVDVSDPDPRDFSGESAPGGGFSGLVAGALAQAPTTSEPSSRIRTALQALFYANFADGPDDPTNTIQEYPLTLADVQVAGDAVVVGILGPFEPRNEEDTERIREQIRHTVTENGGQDAAVSILLNSRDF